MNIPNWKEFKKNNIIQKETRVKIVSMHQALNHIENEINNCLASEQADDVVITKDPGDKETWPHLIIKYTRYQQYTINDDDEYEPTGIFHTRDMYEAYRVKDMLVTNMDMI